MRPLASLMSSQHNGQPGSGAQWKEASHWVYAFEGFILSQDDCPCPVPLPGSANLSGASFTVAHFLPCCLPYHSLKAME